MIPLLAGLLAQAGGAVDAADRTVRTDAAQRIWQAVGWGLLILVVAVTAIVLAMWFKRQILGRPAAQTRDGVGFTLADLRQLHREGKITREEYEQTRDRIVQAAQHALAEASADERPSVDAPQPKNVDLVREAER